MTVRTVGAGEGARLRFAPDAAEQDLYAGLPGIALALGAHGRVTGSEASLVAAREALTTLRALDATQLLSIGAYDGAAGVAWCYMQLAEWLDDAFLLDAAARAVRYIEGALDDDRQFDIVSGAAGAIPVLLELERVRPGALDLAMRCGNHLLEHVTSLDVLPFQRGFAHGASGVAWALTRLSRITGEPRWEERACELLAAEDALIGTGQWSDGPGDTSFAAWCHGAPGIALARADMIRMGAHGGDEHVVEAAVAAAVAAPAHDSHGLCHGELGNIDALFDIADVLDRHDVRANAQQRLHAVLAVMTRDGVRSSGPRFLPNPGMMLGTSGIAWVLMRTATPQLIPSALLPGTVLRAPRTLAAS